MRLGKNSDPDLQDEQSWREILDAPILGPQEKAAEKLVRLRAKRDAYKSESDEAGADQKVRKYPHDDFGRQAKFDQEMAAAQTPAERDAIWRRLDDETQATLRRVNDQLDS